MAAISNFNNENFQSTCDLLAGRDPVLAAMLARDGYPPMWTRPADFSSLVWIILEQQVSLASARAAYDKLAERSGKITPASLLQLSDEDLRNCYFSRQKVIYVRGLAQAITDKTLDLDALAFMDDDSVRAQLTSLKGIGDWTTDVYLMFGLRRADIFPLGDIAVVNSMKHEWKLATDTPRSTLAEMAEKWRPWRSVAAMMLWHAYLVRKKRPASV